MKFKRSEFKLKKLGALNFWFVSVQHNHKISYKSNFNSFQKIVHHSINQHMAQCKDIRFYTFHFIHGLI
jgi:hypothetical protein